MHPARKQRLIFISCLVAGTTIAIALALYALQQNINLFYSPSQVAAGEAPLTHLFRVGGIVEKGSVQHASNSLQVQFILTDNHHQVVVLYDGILPTLFREGQGIIAEGHLSTHGRFLADQVLAKHDENYMPPEVAKSLYHAT